MPAYFFRSEPGADELRRLARRESGRVCQRVLMIANMLEGMERCVARAITTFTISGQPGTARLRQGILMATNRML
jgi:hypothetical protein